MWKKSQVLGKMKMLNLKTFPIGYFTIYTIEKCLNLTQLGKKKHTLWLLKEIYLENKLFLSITRSSFSIFQFCKLF